MGLPNVVEVKQKMVKMGCVDANTKCMINHFSHNGEISHEELCQNAQKLGFITSFDGMSVEI